MRFHNGVPITVVSTIHYMPTPVESASRRRAETEEDARLEAGGLPSTRHGRALRRRSEP